MISENKDLFTGILGGSSTIATAGIAAIQVNEVYQWISLGISILIAIVSISYTCYKWYQKATADKKVTKEEIDELADSLSKQLTEVKEAVASAQSKSGGQSDDVD